MSITQFFVPAPNDNFVELSRTQQGKLFRKHILNKGDLIHPVTKSIIKIDDAFVATMRKNFDAGVCDIVQIPLAGVDNEHSEEPERNIGEVVGIEEKDGKIYALLDVRKHIDDVGKTLLGASAMFHQDYLNDKTGKRVGPTLLHTCVTNRPYVTGLDDYEELVAATATSDNKPVMLTATAASTEESEKMELDAMLEALLIEHDIDVRGLEAQIAALGEKELTGAGAAALSAAIADALSKTGLVSLSAGEVSADEIVGAIAQLADDKVELSARVDSLEHDKASAYIGDLVSKGFILPAQKEAMLELKLTNSAMFEKLLPTTPLVKLSNERGFTLPDPDKEAIAAEDSVRLTAVAAKLGLVKA